jgi:hypothetical protein
MKFLLIIIKNDTIVGLSLCISKIVLSYILLFISGTLYFAMALQSTVLTCVAAVAQVDIIFVGTSALSDRQCRSCNSPGFDPCILWHSGIWGAADEVLFNTEHRKKIQKIPLFIIFFIGSRIAPAISRFKWQWRRRFNTSIMVSVVDPHWFQCGSRPSSESWSRDLMIRNCYILQ